MKKSTTFLDYILNDIFSEIDNITSKPMFSGWGIYKDGIIFALIIQNELYFKTDEHNRPQFLERNSQPFKYDKKGKVICTSYWLLPPEIIENKTVIPEWVKSSVEVKRRQMNM